LQPELKPRIQSQLIESGNYNSFVQAYIIEYMMVFEVILTVHRRYYVEIKGQLDATDYIYCRFYFMLNMFRAILCPSSEAREYVSGLQAAALVNQQPANRTHNLQLHTIPTT